MCIGMHIKVFFLVMRTIDALYVFIQWHISQVHIGRLTVVVHIARSIVLSLSSHIFHRVYSNSMLDPEDTPWLKDETCRVETDAPPLFIRRPVTFECVREFVFIFDVMHGIPQIFGLL